MNRVKRAIILAAGIGERLQPITFLTPKPLISVHGVRMIEGIINSLILNDIFEIYIVVGYKKEKFDYLTKKYRSVCLIENPYYKNTNNISSLYVARDFLEDSIILDGDQIIYNPMILSRDFARSGYNVTWQEERTEEWMLEVEGDIITGCSRNGGSRGWRLYSVSRWNAEDGAKLRKHLEKEFEEKHHTDIYWDDVALFCYPEKYKLGIRQMNPKDIIEIDCIKELVAIDSSYKEYIEDEDEK